MIKRLPLAVDDPLTWIISGLEPRWELQIRLLKGWMRHPVEEVRSSAVYAAELPMRRWRPAAASLVRALAGALTDPSVDVRRWAGRLLAGAGRANATIADELWNAVEGAPMGNHTPGASALIALSRLHDPGADAVLMK
ncbi:hypothetical protein Rhe02_58990 [Rhizocola hellebori]|uniref:HEAT repeat domain-containing protein n=1 Tax=Rhizocola hellebori TaxID=1392758 RepID=A0A8J3QD52_9ACTN|nr:hypothetical protein [Rhizocola hellebori]GIH07832.1 hypothetical protein Rhe02_58990 [Rhizocola hellebori]